MKCMNNTDPAFSAENAWMNHASSFSAVYGVDNRVVLCLATTSPPVCSDRWRYVKKEKQKPPCLWGARMFRKQHIKQPRGWQEGEFSLKRHDASFALLK